MANSEILGIPQIAQNQNNKYITHNNAIDLLEQAGNASYTNSAAGSAAINISEADATKYMVYTFAAADADRDVTWPATIGGNTRKRVWIVKNTTSHALTMKASAPGTSVVVLAGQGAFLYQEGVNVAALGFFEIGSTGKSYDIGLFIPGKPDPGTVMTTFVAARAFYLDDDFAGSTGKVGALPSATMTLDVYKNAGAIGTVSISTAGVFAFATSGSGTVTFAAGDAISIKSTATVPSGVSDVSVTFKGSR